MHAHRGIWKYKCPIYFQSKEYFARTIRMAWWKGNCLCNKSVRKVCLDQAKGSPSVRIFLTILQLFWRYVILSTLFFNESPHFVDVSLFEIKREMSDFQDNIQPICWIWKPSGCLLISSSWATVIMHYTPGTTGSIKNCLELFLSKLPPPCLWHME